MRKFLLSVLLAAAINTQAQDLTLVYAGDYRVIVTSNLACDATATVRWKAIGGDKDTSFSLQSLKSVTISLPQLQPGSEVKAIANGSGCNSNGWTVLGISSTLPVAPSLLVVKETGGVVFRLSEPGIVERSLDGNVYYSLGYFDKIGADHSPAAGLNYYRLKVFGTYSKVYAVKFEKRMYTVYTMLGQYIGRTTDIAPYQYGYLIL